MHKLTKIKLSLAKRKGDHYEFLLPEPFSESELEPVPFVTSSPDKRVVQGLHSTYEF